MADQEPVPGPVVILRQSVVEPGDAAPEGGKPFLPEENYDQDLGPSVKVFKRGEKISVVSSIGPLTEEAIEGLKVEAQRVAEGTEGLQPVAPLVREADLMEKYLIDRGELGVMDEATGLRAEPVKPGAAPA